MNRSTICRGHWERQHKRIPLRGPLSVFYKPFGIHTSQMNPNLCNICENNFVKMTSQQQITISASILFADLRGYTDLSQHVEPTKMHTLLHHFYDQCSNAIWEYDGIVNKFIGDAVFAIFNFPLERENHAEMAVHAALRLQENCTGLKNEMGLDASIPFGVGIGVHTGMCSMGEFGTAYKDFTAIGPVVNLASRLQGAAGPGEILVTEEVYTEINTKFPNAESRMLSLKGISEPLKGFTITNKI